MGGTAGGTEREFAVYLKKYADGKELFENNLYRMRRMNLAGQGVGRRRLPSIGD